MNVACDYEAPMQMLTTENIYSLLDSWKISKNISSVVIRSIVIIKIHNSYY